MGNLTYLKSPWFRTGNIHWKHDCGSHKTADRKHSKMSSSTQKKITEPSRKLNRTVAASSAEQVYWLQLKELCIKKEEGSLTTLSCRHRVKNSYIVHSNQKTQKQKHVKFFVARNIRGHLIGQIQWLLESVIFNGLLLHKQVQYLWY